MNDYGLLFYFSEDFMDADVTALRLLVQIIASTRLWSFEPPSFVDETDDSPEPLRTVGGFLPLPPPNEMGRAPEAILCEEVSYLIDALSAFNVTTGCEFELELGGIYVGSIANGQPDRLVTVGLLDEWRKGL